MTLGIVGTAVIGHGAGQLAKNPPNTNPEANVPVAEVPGSRVTRTTPFASTRVKPTSYDHAPGDVAMTRDESPVHNATEPVAVKPAVNVLPNVETVIQGPVPFFC